MRSVINGEPSVNSTVSLVIHLLERLVDNVSCSVEPFLNMSD